MLEKNLTTTCFQTDAWHFLINLFFFTQSCGHEDGCISFLTIKNSESLNNLFSSASSIFANGELFGHKGIHL